MDGPGSSLRVNVQALVDLAQLLHDQLDEIQRSIRAVGEINGNPELPLASFAESFSLSDDHADVTAQMAVLVGKLSQAEEFAANATRIVAQRYSDLNAAGAQNIAASVTYDT